MCLNSVLNVEVLVGSRFEPGDGPSRGLLRDCENIADKSFAALVIRVLVTKTGLQGGAVRGVLEGGVVMRNTDGEVVFRGRYLGGLPHGWARLHPPDCPGEAVHLLYSRGSLNSSLAVYVDTGGRVWVGRYHDGEDEE